MKLILRLVLLAAIGFGPRGFAQSTSNEAAQPRHIFTKDMTVYVRDFELDAQNVQVDKGPGGQVRPGIIERPRKREQQDPEAQAKKLVDTMSKSLIDDLHKAGYKAERLSANDPPPSRGSVRSRLHLKITRLLGTYAPSHTTPSRARVVVPRKTPRGLQALSLLLTSDVLPIAHYVPPS